MVYVGMFYVHTLGDLEEQLNGLFYLYLYMVVEHTHTYICTYVLTSKKQTKIIDSFAVHQIEICGKFPKMYLYKTNIHTYPFYLKSIQHTHIIHI